MKVSAMVADVSFFLLDEPDSDLLKRREILDRELFVAKDR